MLDDLVSHYLIKFVTPVVLMFRLSILHGTNFELMNLKPILGAIVLVSIEW